ncbi:MAG: phage tail protein [Candidatus Gastranaerophilaceae bacterium]
MYKSILPKNIQDESNLALEKCMDKSFDISLTPFMTSLTDTLSKNVLFLKAQQLSLTDGDGWQNCKTEQDKRDLLKKTLRIHKFKATEQCIHELINKSDTTIKMSNWFEYEGINNHYKLECEANNIAEIENLIKNIQQNKRLSTKLDKLIYNLSQTVENNFAIIPCIGETVLVDFT